MRATETFEKTKEIIADIDRMQEVSMEQLEDGNRDEAFENYHLPYFAYIYKSEYKNNYYIEYIATDEIDIVNKQGLTDIIFDYLYNI